MEKREEPSYFVGGNVNWYMENSMEVLGKLKVELEKETATHSSIIAWKISWTEEPGELQSMGSQRVGHNWATNTYLPYDTAIPLLGMYPEKAMV